MDLASFQLVYPELIVEHARHLWVGEKMEYYNFVFKTWQKMSLESEPLLFSESKVKIEDIEGAIRSAQILNEVEIALINIQENSESLIGLIRGRRLRNKDDGDFSLESIDWSNNNFHTYSAEEYESPEFFSPEDDLKELLQ